MKAVQANKIQKTLFYVHLSHDSLVMHLTTVALYSGRAHLIKHEWMHLLVRNIRTTGMHGLPQKHLHLSA